MKRLTMVSLLLLLVLGSLPASTAEREGSLPEELAARKPPAPNDLYVAVLPFWSRDERQSETARACVLLNLMRHEFRFAPKGSPSLPVVVRRTDAALKKDSAWEPLARLDPALVARVGAALGARWAIYGEFGELHTTSEKGGILPRKVGVIDLRLVLVEVPSGEILYWSRVQDTGSGGGGLLPAKATSVERRLVTQTINGIFDDLATAMPEHHVGAEVTSEEVRRVVEAMGK